MSSPSHAPFPTTDTYKLISQPFSDQQGEEWKEVNKTGEPTGKVVGYSALAAAPYGQEANSTIDWGCIEPIKDSTRYMKCDVTLS
jgi:hypothetical protein